jgi:hypothetical protein
MVLCPEGTVDFSPGVLTLGTNKINGSEGKGEG